MLGAKCIHKQEVRHIKWQLAGGKTVLKCPENAAPSYSEMTTNRSEQQRTGRLEVPAARWVVASEPWARKAEQPQHLNLD